MKVNKDKMLFVKWYVNCVSVNFHEYLFPFWTRLRRSKTPPGIYDIYMYIQSSSTHNALLSFDIIPYIVMLFNIVRFRLIHNVITIFNHKYSASFKSVCSYETMSFSSLCFKRKNAKLASGSFKRLAGSKHIIVLALCLTSLCSFKCIFSIIEPSHVHI